MKSLYLKLVFLLIWWLPVIAIGQDCRVPQPNTAPVLIKPIKGEVVNSWEPIRFHWSMVASAEGFLQSALLRIVEVLPGQSIAQAFRSNMPLMERHVTGITQEYLTPMDFSIHYGDSMHLAWTIIPLAPFGIDLQYNQATAEPADFWLTDGLYSKTLKLPISRISPCGIVDAGKDQVTKGGINDAVFIGTPNDEIYDYEWVSDPPGYHAYRSFVKVNPAITTRYLLIRTDSATGCKVMDEVWVVVDAPFKVELEVDACGTIRAITKPLLAADPHHSSPNDIDPPGPKVYNGLVLPPAKSRPRNSILHYKWSNGSNEASITPKFGDPKTYTVTVSNGKDSTTATIVLDHGPTNNFKGNFPVLSVPSKIMLGQKAFHIDHHQHAASTPPYNATSYRLTIIGPNEYVRIQEDNTISGFENGAILWDEAPVGGVTPKPGKYYWFLSLRNCDYPIHDPSHLYRVCRAEDNPTNPRIQWKLMGKFEATQQHEYLEKSTQ